MFVMIVLPTFPDIPVNIVVAYNVVSSLTFTTVVIEIGFAFNVTGISGKSGVMLLGGIFVFI